MADTDFAMGASLLFAATESIPEQESMATEVLSQGQRADLMLPLNPLFAQQTLDPSSQSEVSTEILPLQDLITGETNNQTADKMVKLFNGLTMLLQPRRRKNNSLDFSEDPDAIMNMDKLYKRVSHRELLRATQETIRKSRKQSILIETATLLQLWLEKYKPKSYFQICPAGNERQYRHIMHWLRKWGAVVFRTTKDEDESVDSLGRPLRKILLVHGPPGIGKTAVVHLLAQHMGYSVEELNAANSMDAMHGADSADGARRFANATEALKLKVKNALTTNTITSKGKPTCLVIDEIDSAINTGDIVKVITELVRIDQTNLRTKESQDFRNDSQQKGGRMPFYLNRPIICIADDIYNTTSRSWGQSPMEILRPLCETVAFRKPATSSSPRVKINASAHKSVKEFLMQISDAEKLDLESKEVAEVFEICDGDIRACINYLQFSSRKLNSDIHCFTHKNSPEAANKDTLMPWFSLVDQIFRRNQNISKEENFEEMLDLVSSGGGKSATSSSLEKVIRGCFNKYLDIVHLQDGSALRPAEISDWLFYYDLLTTQNLSSHFYPTLTTLKFWSLFSDINPQKFRNMNGLIPDASSLDFSSREALKQNRAVVGKLTDLIPVDSKVSLCGMTPNNAFYACEFIPLVDKMLSPEVGSSKSKFLLKPHETVAIDKLAHLIKTLDIKLETQRDVESNQAYLVYGPDWEGITMFSSGEQNIEQRKRSLNVKRQWLFPLLQSELDSLMSATLPKRQREDTKDQSSDEVKQKRNKITSSLDFFKRRYDNLLSKIASTATPVNREATRIWVKHHEGFSNAVRKNIGWHELWH